MIERRIADVLHRYFGDAINGYRDIEIAEVLVRELKIIDAGEGLFVGQYVRVRADTEEPK